MESCFRRVRCILSILFFFFLYLAVSRLSISPRFCVRLCVSPRASMSLHPVLSISRFPSVLCLATTPLIGPSLSPDNFVYASITLSFLHGIVGFAHSVVLVYGLSKKPSPPLSSQPCRLAELIYRIDPPLCILDISNSKRNQSCLDPPWSVYL